VRPLQGRTDVAYLALSSDHVSPDIPTRCVRELSDRGFAAVVTNALAPADALPFLDAGFAVRERLDLLEHRMRTLPPTHRTIVRMRRADVASVLTIDGLAFDDDWRLDSAGLADAIGATPVARARIAHTHDREVLGYAITGRAGHRGYLQRVAVHPNVRRLGWGRAFVGDALGWLRRHGVQRTVVNTQVGNASAHALYRECGFEPLPVGLCVLGRDL